MFFLVVKGVRGRAKRWLLYLHIISPITNLPPGEVERGRFLFLEVHGAGAEDARNGGSDGDDQFQDNVPGGLLLVFSCFHVVNQFSS